jgi:hypothetical protein
MKKLAFLFFAVLLTATMSSFAQTGGPGGKPGDQSGSPGGQPTIKKFDPRILPRPALVKPVVASAKKQIKHRGIHARLDTLNIDAYGFHIPVKSIGKGNMNYDIHVEDDDDDNSVTHHCVADISLVREINSSVGKVEQPGKKTLSCTFKIINGVWYLVDYQIKHTKTESEIVDEALGI